MTGIEEAFFISLAAGATIEVSKGAKNLIARALKFSSNGQIKEAIAELEELEKLEETFAPILAEIKAGTDKNATDHEQTVTLLGRILSQFNQIKSIGEMLKIPNEDWDAANIVRPPSSLLMAQYGIVKFHKREQELADLDVWCKDDKDTSKISMRLFTGAGGMGKTRLFIEFAKRMKDEGWQAGFLPDNILQEKYISYTTEKHLLIVIDYAERRNKEVAEFIKRLLSIKSKFSVRIILIARSEADWWSDLKNSDKALREFMGSEKNVPKPISLEPFEAKYNEREEIYDLARESFEKKLKLPKTNITKPDLGKPVFDRVLMIHLSALAATQGEKIEDENDLLDDIISREKEFLEKQLADKKYGLDAGLDDAILQLLAIFTLLGGAADKKQAERYLSLSNLLGGQDNNVCNKVLKLLKRMYPPAEQKSDDGDNNKGSKKWISGLEPDLLGERFVSDYLRNNDQDNEILDLLFSSELSKPAYNSTLTVLTRIANREPDFENRIQKIIENNYYDINLIAFDVALQTGDPMGDVLAEVLNNNHDYSFAYKVYNKLFKYSISLIKLSLIVREICLEHSNDEKEKVKILINLSICQTNLDKHNKALESIEEAFTISRKLAERNPNSFWPDKIMILNNMSGCLKNLGKFEEALENIEEAVKISRQMSKNNPDAFMPDLAMSLNNLSDIKKDLNLPQIKSALSKSEESVKIYRKLIEKDIDRFLPDLVNAMNTLAVVQSKLDLKNEALKNLKEILEIYEQLAEKYPDVYLPDLARTLNNKAVLLSDLKKKDESLINIKRAVAIGRKLVNKNPNSFLKNLSSYLNNLSTFLQDDDKVKESLIIIQEVVEIRRKLVKRYPDAILPDLAESLINTSIYQTNLGICNEAIKNAEEAVEIFSVFVKKFPQVFEEKYKNALEALEEAKNC